MESEIERLRKKVENYPSASAYNRLAELARLNGDVQEAERVCQRCIKEFPRNGQTYVIVAEIALAAGRRDEALSSLQNAIERDPRSYGGHRMIADLYLESGETAKALHHLRQILAFKPTDQAVTQRIEEISRQHPATPAATASAAPASAPTAPTMTPFASPASGAAPVLSAKPAPAPANRAAALQALAAEPGVRGIVIADPQGRVVVAQGLADDDAEILAAFAAELTAAATATLQLVGADGLASWLVDAEQGQVLAFKRDPVLTLAVVAAPGTRAALLELRARQALIDLGVA